MIGALALEMVGRSRLAHRRVKMLTRGPIRPSIARRHGSAPSESLRHGISGLLLAQVQGGPGEDARARPS